MPNVAGVLEVSLYVDDVERSSEFYCDLFEFKILSSDDRHCALSVDGRQVLQLFRKGATSEPFETRGGAIPSHGGNGEIHLAFSIADTEWDSWQTALKGEGIAVESEVTWLAGGRSMYFRDPDRNLIELITQGAWSIY
jgi:catechol 2,3-dioxygenase-like lactoylglutathione lyase family enzyme